MSGFVNTREQLQTEFNREYPSHGYALATVETRDVPEDAKARIHTAFAAFCIEVAAVMDEVTDKAIAT